MVLVNQNSCVKLSELQGFTRWNRGKKEGLKRQRCFLTKNKTYRRGRQVFWLMNYLQHSGVLLVTLFGFDHHPHDWVRRQYENGKADFKVVKPVGIALILYDIAHQGVKNKGKHHDGQRNDQSWFGPGKQHDQCKGYDQKAQGVVPDIDKKRGFPGNKAHSEDRADVVYYHRQEAGGIQKHNALGVCGISLEFI